MVRCKENYIGKKFNHLTVVKQVDDYKTEYSRPKAQFLCECDCKAQNPNQLIVRLDSLKNGHTSSCGCAKSALTVKRNNERKIPLYEEETLKLNIVQKGYEPYGKFRLANIDKWVYFSMSDYDLIKNYHWYGYKTRNTDYQSVKTMINGKPVSMHQLFGLYKPDHINRNPLDNRRENLDINATASIQCQNRKIQCNNQSGCKGVDYVRARQGWRSRIIINYREINLGIFSKKEDAIIARLEAEKQYFDKRAWQIDLMEKYKCL